MMTWHAEAIVLRNCRGVGDRPDSGSGLGSARFIGSADFGMARVSFASCYVYSPSGPGVISERSRLLRALLKAGDGRFIGKYAGRVRQLAAAAAPLAGYFDATCLLVPIPANGPCAARAPSVAQSLACALHREGLARGIWSGLRRRCVVRKSATAAPGTRPTVADHYESFAVDPIPENVRRIVIVDDVITKGRTLFAAAARLHDAFPNADIRAFAMLRTMGLAPSVGRLLDPCVGEIVWSRGDARRNP